jgi:hypothetical protein
MIRIAITPAVYAAIARRDGRLSGRPFSFVACAYAIGMEWDG